MADISFDADTFVADIESAIEEVEDIQERYTGGETWFVGSAVEYAIYLEFGTRDMDPKPFLRPALLAYQSSLEAAIAADTETTLDAIDSVDELVQTIAFGLERRIKRIIKGKGLIDTGALRASIAAVPAESELKGLSDVAARADVDLDPEAVA